MPTPMTTGPEPAPEWVGPAGPPREDPAVLQDDLRDLLAALGLGTHARPVSPHQVLQGEVLPALRQMHTPCARCGAVGDLGDMHGPAGLMVCSPCQPATTHEASPVDIDRPCDHPDFVADVEVNRLSAADGGPITAYSATIRVTCVCGERMRWIGAPAGLLPTQPCVSVDETELRAPLRPASSDPDFGLGIPGFSIRAYGPEAGR